MRIAPLRVQDVVEIARADPQALREGLSGFHAADLEPEANAEEAVCLVAKYGFSALPVVGGDRRVLGSSQLTT